MAIEKPNPRFKPKALTPPVNQKPFSITPLPSDFTKGKLDMQGAFGFYKAEDAFEWADRVWANKDNRLWAYVYRQKPVVNFQLSLAEPYPDLGNNISRWESWPFTTKDFHVGMLEMFGGGQYLILFHDQGVSRKVAKLDGWSLPNYENYPPRIRVDDVVIDNIDNKPFIAWARQAGCLFPNDQGYTPGKFVHIETKLHRQKPNSEGDFMNNGPIGTAVQEVVGGFIKDAVENFRAPAPQAQQQQSNVAQNLDHMAAVSAIDLVKETHKEMTERKSQEQNALLGLVTTLVTERSKPDTSQSEGFKIALETISKMSEMQIAMLKADRDSLAARIERMESRPTIQPQIVAAPASYKAPEDQVLEYLDKQEAIMERLGYSRRGSTSRQPEPPQRDMLQTIIDALPGLLQTGMQAYASHMQVQLRIAELTAAQSNPSFVAPNRPPTTVNTAPLHQSPPPPHAQSQPQQPHNQSQSFGVAQPPQPPSTVNEEMRALVGPQFDYYVANFHGELTKLAPVINKFFIDGINSITRKKAESLEEQTKIMEDYGTKLAQWYTDTPENMHKVLITFQDDLLPAIKTFKPIWNVVGAIPEVLTEAFIDGFCVEFVADEDDETQTATPVKPVEPIQ
jgi:hypothetical protein